jgi:hypothetical protein
MKILGIYKNNNNVYDPYTVVYDEQATDKTLLCLCLREDGGWSHSDAVLGKHLGKPITFAQLPTACQYSMLQDIIPDNTPEVVQKVIKRMLLGEVNA